MWLAQEDPSVQIAAEAMQAFRAESAQEAAPGALPEAVLQLLPKNLYTGKLTRLCSDCVFQWQCQSDRCCPASDALVLQQ